MFCTVAFNTRVETAPRLSTPSSWPGVTIQCMDASADRPLSAFANAGNRCEK